MLYLRQSTASQSVVIGPFVDSTDGNTEETGLTIANTDIRLSKNGANIVGKNSGGGTHDELGYYTITLDATDTNTVGRLQLMVHASGALPVYHEFHVVEEAVYDRDYASSATGIIGTSQTGDAFARLGAPAGASIAADIAAIEAQTDDIGAAGAGLTAIPWNSAWDAEVQSEVADALAAAEPLDANVTQWSGSAVATPTNAGVPEVDVTHWMGVAVTDELSTVDDLGVMIETTIATLASQTSFTLTAGSGDDDAYNDRLVMVQDASTATQKCVGSVSDYTGSTKTVTLAADPGVFTIATGDTVRIYAIPAGGGSGLDAAGVRAAVGLASANLDTQLSTIDGNVDSILADTGTDGVVVASIAANAISATAIASNAITAAKIATDAITAAKIATDAVTEIQSGLSTLDAAGVRTAVGLASANLDTQLSTIDTVVDAILVDTGTTLDGALSAVDTVVDAIKAKTDSLTFTVVGQVDSNIQSINDTTITGDGQTGTEFGV
jgi:hypothetical protein